MFGSLFTSTSTSSPDMTSLLACLAASLVMGAALALLYCFRHGHTQSFAVTLALMPAMVCTVITLVNGSVGAGVAVMGAFSLVRFRSIPGSARDIGFVFLAMSVGLAAGMGYVAVASLVCVVVGGSYLLFTLAGLGASSVRHRALRITVPEDLDFTGMFDDLLATYTCSSELTSIKTTGMGSLYKLVYNVELKPKASEKELLDEVRCRNGNLEVALTHQEVRSNEL